jgi:hypothetical protein
MGRILVARILGIPVLRGALELKKIAAGFSAAEKSALFHDKAERVYRLDRE